MLTISRRSILFYCLLVEQGTHDDCTSDRQCQQTEELIRGGWAGAGDQKEEDGWATHMSDTVHAILFGRLSVLILETYILIARD